MCGAINISKTRAIDRLNEMLAIIPEVEKEIIKIGPVNENYPKHLFDLATEVLMFSIRANVEEVK